MIFGQNLFYHFIESPSELSPAPSAPTVDGVEQEEQYKKLIHSKFVVTSLEGHSDVVWSVAAENHLVLSASRDTTVKVWDAIKGEEVCNLRGHTNSVSGVVFPSQEASAALAVRLDCPSSQRLAISGALDCSLIVWSIPNGHLLKSVYTYNGITAVAIVEKELLVVTGTDGGKVELWDVVIGEAKHSVHGHEENVTCIATSDSNQVFTTSVDGVVKVWTIRLRRFQLLYALEEESSRGLARPLHHSLKTVVSHSDKIYLGNDGVNIKILDWKNGRMERLRNCIHQRGSTDALCVTGDLLLASSYNLDMDTSSVNFFYLPNGDYLTSVSCDKASRILSLATTVSEDGDLRFVTGGSRLLVWDFLPHKARKKRKSPTAEIIRSNYFEALSEEAEASQTEKEDTESELTDDSLEEENQCEMSLQSRKNWLSSWCSLF
ncbi:F-box/WD repeat-containing protein 7-like [Limulus polyphemus]|uniref:F-box/WD repeat-containing protein 7-like n=1 Tax=Limulus polyphemus TaxID=6850 RepID=A0ABM1BXJ6_LIMPO|nr:F-box/WD repeat-containing protein 7-like [Limulus polyphemus]